MPINHNLEPPEPPPPPSIRRIKEGGPLLDFAGSISFLLIALVLCAAAGYVIGVNS